MAKPTLKILLCSQRKILKVCLPIFKIMHERVKEFSVFRIKSCLKFSRLYCGVNFEKLKIEIVYSTATKIHVTWFLLLTFFTNVYSQPTSTCSKSIMETPEQCKSVQDTRTTSMTHFLNCSGVSIFDFELVNAGWDCCTYKVNLVKFLNTK